ncbi:Na+/H+ antiporter NhaC [Paraliomyxa miuraensis]|uniref:Na+/H+ antiporter NhaC n=1 Tax=Paraliomyxa miuraensis TaxID=376150 RepID=UPI00225BA14F|nr:Na+/H+ antiporter NhaC [Paraliomyxa miuraensis]MCX4241430.1 Na+/H+ antiporter NhaC [Paraliomyxa miuraensis]
MADDAPSTREPREIPAGWALVPVLALVALLTTVLIVLPRLEPGFEGTGHLPLLAAAAVAAAVAHRFGHDWNALELAVVEAIRMAMRAILILLVIGMLMGTWLAGGIVPALIHWGLMLLSPGWFLPTACAVCSIVSLVSGSSWSTAGTVGLAMIGIGGAMGIDPAMTAGAVVSGAYFGDKLSPMSDTTNLAPAMAGTELFTHIRHQVLTTGPAWAIAMVGYTILGLTLDPNTAAAGMGSIGATIEANFHPGLLHLLPPLVVVGLVLRGKPALPVLLLGVVLGAVVAVAAEGATVGSTLSAAMSGYVATTGDAAVDELLSRGGMSSMGSTVFLVLCAMSFGGIMEGTGMLRALAARLLRAATNTGRLIATTVLTSVGINVVAGDQYISIVVPGRMYAATYRERGLHPKNLSRALEDGGTITSPLIPWNTCGAFMAATLMVPTGAYLGYAFLNIVNPLISILYGVMGWTIAPADPPSAGPHEDSSRTPST